MDKCAGLPVLASSAVIPPISSMSALDIPPREVDNMIDQGVLLLSLGDSHARVPPSSPTENFLKLPTPDSNTHALLEAPNQEDVHGSLHEPSDSVPASTSEVAGNVTISPSKTSANTPPADT